jgi:prepilin-type N-terminal cleavage/methylation domain-containing protein
MSHLRSESGSAIEQASGTRSGFTLLELLTVTAVMGVLAGLLFPALHHAASKSQGILCVGNLRQLTLGWLMYSDDQQGWLCPNDSLPKQRWVEGVMNFDVNSTDNTNAQYLVDPEYAKLGPYVPSSAVYHCPADKSLVSMNRQKLARVRSVAMNEAVGVGAAFTVPPRDSWSFYHKQSEILSPTPSSLWVMIEQHPDSIDDGRFDVDCGSRGPLAQWIDFPSNFHDRSCGLSFADGHAEIHRWVADVSRPPNRYCGCLSHYAANGHFTSAPDSPDIAWLQERTSAKREH